MLVIAAVAAITVPVGLRYWNLQHLQSLEELRRIDVGGWLLPAYHGSVPLVGTVKVKGWTYQLSRDAIAILAGPFG